MNYGISVLFRLIPVVMAMFCFAYGSYIYCTAEDPSHLTAGPVIFFLGSICMALYTTASTIIRQLIGTYNNLARYGLPVLAYTLAVVTFVVGLTMLVRQPVPEFFVAGHVVCGLGLITACVATAATSSSRFTLIRQNSTLPPVSRGTKPTLNPAGFTRAQETVFEALVIAIACVAWIWAIVLLSQSSISTHLVAGCVMSGIACVCTSLITLVASISRQIRGNYSEREKTAYPAIVLAMGILALIWGLLMIIFNWGKTVDFVGFVLIGLGMICLSISSKVILLAKVWRAEFKLANRIPLIPILTALFCLFLAAFLFEEGVTKQKFLVPSRVLMGFGAICFTLFSIVSILESGTQKSE